MSNYEGHAKMLEETLKNPEQYPAAQDKLCEHHWVSIHQPHLPINFIRQCSLCKKFDGSDMRREISKAGYTKHRENRTCVLPQDHPGLCTDGNGYWENDWHSSNPRTVISSGDITVDIKKDEEAMEQIKELQTLHGDHTKEEKIVGEKKLPYGTYDAQALEANYESVRVTAKKKKKKKSKN